MKTIGVIGCPILHSISPQMHSAAINLLELDYTYERFEVKPEDLKEFVGRIRSGEIHGINVTIPHKEKIMEYLDEIEDFAKSIGAVNTVINKDGRLIGYNTDHQGFIDSLTTDKITASRKRVVLIGCGGASKAISAALCTSNIARLVLYDVDSEKAKSLESNLKKYFNANIAISSNIIEEIKISDLIINATPVGMYPDINEMPIPDVSFSKDQDVYEVIYNPAETKFLKTARESGAKTVNGMNMFVRQGALSFKIFTGHDAPIEVMKNAVLTALKVS